MVETGKLGRTCVYNMYGHVQQPKVMAELWAAMLRDAEQSTRMRQLEQLVFDLRATNIADDIVSPEKA
jgi:hypothetical protein